MVIIETTKEEELTQLEQLYRNSEGLQQQGSFRVNRQPLPEVKLRNIDEDTPQDDILNDFRDRLDLEGQHQVEIKHIRKERNGTQTAIISVPRNKYRAILRKEKTKIGWNCVTIEENLRIRRCGRCLSYGHSPKYCKAPSARCPGCSGGHTWDECKATKMNCNACCEFNAKNDCRREVQHHFFSKECPTYLEEAQRARERI